jgi:glycosyltransferase involved in cell wall biosynthesis
MTLPVYIYDPTQKDTASKVRGVGTYLTTLKENFEGIYNFTADINSIPKDAIFINPFFNILQGNQKLFSKISRRQAAVIHDLIPLKFPQYFPIGLFNKITVFLNKTFAIKKYDIIVTDSEHSKRDIVRLLNIPANKVYVLYPTVKNIFCRPIALSDSYEQSNISPDKDPQFANNYHATHFSIDQQSIINSIPFDNFCIYVGDGTWNKNLLTLANAVKAAQIPCVVTGKVFTDFRQKMSAAGTNKPSVHPWEKSLYKFYQTTYNNPLFYFTGYVSDHDLVSLYKKAKVNVLISYDEGFGLSYLEASYLGTPTVLADTPLFHEIAQQDAIYAKYDDANDVADKIRKVIFQEKISKHLRVDVFERAYDFSPDNFKNRMTSIINMLQK